MKFNRWLRTLFILIATIIVLFVTLTIPSSTAYYIRNSNVIDDTYSPAGFDNPKIVENKTGVEDEIAGTVYVEVPDKGYPVWVRVAIIITWKDAKGNVYHESPKKGRDYEIVINTGSWEKNRDYGEFYYHKQKVATGGKTANLIASCKLLKETANIPKDHTLSVEFIIQTIQAVGTTDDPNNSVDAWIDAWGRNK